MGAPLPDGRTGSYVTCAHAISFAGDLKIAHYVKVGVAGDGLGLPRR